MPGAVLYRHWLELRFLVLATLGPWILLCSVTAFLAVALAREVSAVVVHAWGLSIAVVFGIFVAVVAGLWSAGRDVPLGSMAASMVLGLAVAVSIQALVGLVLPLVTERFSPALLSLIPVGVILAIARTLDDSATGWIHVVRFLEFQPARWDIVGLLLVGVLSSLGAAAVLVRVRDF